MVSFMRHVAGIAFLLALVLLLPSLAGAQLLTGYEQRKQELAEAKETGKDAPVNLSADDLQHDDTGQTVTATGHVELVQAGRILKADQVVYNLQSDTVTARGHIALLDTNGNIHFADEVELNNEMKRGFVNGLQMYLSDGGHFTAKRGEKEGNTIVMKDAAYTPCECETDDEGDPAWQIKADTVTYNQDENRISYKNAKFEIFGVPVAWLPFLAHSDGKIKRKSGFLAPDVGYKSQLGLVATTNYYWAMAPDHDLTTGVMAMTSEKPVAVAAYRQRFDNADMKISGSFTHSGRTDDIGGEDVKLKDEWRGHLFADSRWDVNDKWRAGTSLELTSDDQYLRQYDFSSKGVLENEIYAERFSGRNYLSGRALAFQDVRVLEDRTDQPNVLPEITASFMGEPNGLAGGRWAADLSLLGLERGGSGQDMQRVSGKLGWQARVVTDSGLVNTVEASVRGDAYMTHDNETALPGSARSRSGAATRAFPQAQIVTSYPLAKPLQKAQAVVEPVVALTASTDINNTDTDIPNEDSQDVQLDAGNLFDADRFPGLDKIEDGVRLTYGGRVGLYGYEGSHADVFVGQSFRFEQGDNPFPDGSGLSGQHSDIVGQVSASYDNRYSLNYRFQLDDQRLSSQRHELDAGAQWNRFNLGTRYLFAKGLEGTDITESREQIENSLGYKLTRKWRVRGSALHDLGEDPGLRKASVGLDYFGCCLSFSANAQRTLTRDATGDNGTDITFRLGLKGLGEFQNGNSGAPLSYGEGR